MPYKDREFSLSFFILRSLVMSQEFYELIIAFGSVVSFGIGYIGGFIYGNHK